MAVTPLLACDYCATLHKRAPLEPAQIASCTRCGEELYRQSRLSLNGWIALTLTALILFVIANYFPIAHLRIQGMQVDASLPGALLLTWRQGHEMVAIMTAMAGFWMPLTQLLITLWALMAVRAGRLPGDFAWGLRVLHWVEPWSMIPVLTLAIIVAVVKFSSLADITPAPAIWAFGILTFLLTGLTRVAARNIWRYAEDAGLVPISGLAATSMGEDADTRLGAQACTDMHGDANANVSKGNAARILLSCTCCGYVQAAPAGLFTRYIEDPGAALRCRRCNSRIYPRKPDMRARVWALLIAASIIYLPANLLPIMRVRTLVEDGNHTILGGVLELWRLGSPDLAIIVFVASIVVPVTKIVVLVLLMLRDRWQGEAIARSRTRLYGFVEFIGQWSMLDVFVVILMSAMANFPGVSQVLAGPGAASFGMVVVLTMLAAHCFDPRSAWDHGPVTAASPRTTSLSSTPASMPLVANQSARRRAESNL
ncbi:paraquat-inducible membrane protein A [Pusillimonas sp. TS35]|nr:paraquat-inducible membrane protein A [Pusillimonas sp. TS35]